MLDPEVQQLWAEYLTTEKDRIRDVMMDALERFIDKLWLQPPADRSQWAKELASSISDHGAAVPVRLPLFRRILLPVLADGVQRREPGCARWLAHFEVLLLHSKNVQLPDHLRSAVGLLREALRTEPSDDVARRRLVHHLAGYHEYTLHELPAGVLYQTDEATREQCDELLQFLAEFKSEVLLSGQQDRYDELIKECEFHYISYRDYLDQGQPRGSYEAYLERE